MELNYGPEKQLAFLTSNTYNGGGWVKVEAARALRNNVETGVLRVTLNGVSEDLMDTIALPRAITFQMDQCLIFFGGLPPTYEKRAFTFNRRQLESFLGSMRAITISNPGSNSLMNPLYTQRYRGNPYHGVEPHCERTVLKRVSFSGDGYLEVKAQTLRRDCSFGFSFRTFLANSVLVLSTFQGRSGGNDANYYSVSLLDGKLLFKFAAAAAAAITNMGRRTEFATARSYNDGHYHTVSVKKVATRVYLYVDDNLVCDSVGLDLGDRTLEIPAPSDGGLFIGGVPFIIRDSIEHTGSTGSVNGFVGTISDLAFIDDVSVRVIAMNEPVAIERAHVGREMYFPSMDWEPSFVVHESSWKSAQRNVQSHQPGTLEEQQNCAGTERLRSGEVVKNAAFFNKLLSSHMTVKLKRSQRNFNISLHLMTNSEDGLILAIMVCCCC
jgi:hypothetical protein